MRLSRAFIMVSVFSYLTMLVFFASALNVVVEFDSGDPTIRGNGVIASVLLAIMLIYSLVNNDLNLIWSGVFGALAFNSFIGLIHWVNYFNTPHLNLYMCTWDLLIGVCLVYESEMYV